MKTLMTKVSTLHFHAPQPSFTRLKSFKEILSSSSSSPLKEQQLQLINLLKPIAKVFGESDRLEYKIASLFLLSDVYAKIYSLQRILGDDVAKAYQTYVQARKSLEKAQDLLDGQHVDNDLILSLVPQDTSDPKVALGKLETDILPILQEAAEKIPTHISIKQ